jgi:glutamate synthase (ferredoxin)
MLYRFDDIKDDFVKVIPREYKRVLELTAQAKADGLDDEAAEERAFQVMRKGM